VSASDSHIVESRLARARALLFAMEAVAHRADDWTGNVGETCGWLRELAVDELDKVKAVLGTDVTDRPC
jgi:hypothetical protein